MTSYTTETTTATVDGMTYVGKPLTVDQAETIFAPEADPKKRNRAIIAAVFSIPEDDVAKLPWPAYTQMVDDALELCGLKSKGEVTATNGSTSA